VQFGRSKKIKRKMKFDRENIGNIVPSWYCNQPPGKIEGDNRMYPTAPSSFGVIVKNVCPLEDDAIIFSSLE
jgi:hypothetical protein